MRRKSPVNLSLGGWSFPRYLTMCHQICRRIGLDPKMDRGRAASQVHGGVSRGRRVVSFFMPSWDLHFDLVSRIRKAYYEIMGGERIEI